MSVYLIQSDATRIPLGAGAVDLTFGSPPYCDARTYGIGAQRKCVEWVEWMLTVVAECQRVTTGPVLMVAAGVTRDRNYWPACEGLMWEWWKRGGDCQLYRPVAWSKNGIPGSGGNDWLRADWEYVMCFKGRGPLAWADNTACGSPPAYSTGPMSNRLKDGARCNDPFGFSVSNRGRGRYANGQHKPKPANEWSESQQGNCGRRPNGEQKKWHTKREPDGVMRIQKYAKPKLANPGTVLRVEVGGGRLGSQLAHENEAPFPESLAEFFVKSFCPPGGKVLDPFSGSATTAAVAERFGRIGIGCDLRMSQCALGRRRLRESREAVLRGKKPKKRRVVTPAGEPLLFSA